ncbi:MAG: dihydropteroate synthase [Acidobacteria bacterium]|nr:dihydropteroate synthase [Acidobacteriota bacterium]
MIAPRRRHTLSLPDGRILELGARTLLMGIINVTPDSFADGGACLDPARALDAAMALEAAGADLLDVGGESTRPGADPLPADVECARVLPVLDALAGRIRVPVSIDTYKADVARRALAAGASIVNDVSALRYDPAIARVAAAAGAPLVLMHSRGRSRAMYREAQYADVAAEVTRELASAVRAATAAGVARSQIVVDPGLGFAKRAEQTLELLGRLQAVSALGRPVLIGPSRKSFLTAAIGECPPSEREWGTASAVAAAVILGAHIVRVHAVTPHVDVVRVADSIRAHAMPQ